MLPPAGRAPGVVVAALSDTVLAAYCPVLYLHHEDKYLPTSVEWFIERARLNYYPGGVSGAAEVHELGRVPGGVINLIPAGQVNQENLLEAQASCQHPGNLSLTVGPEDYGGCLGDRLGEVPIYAHAKLVVDDDGDPEAYEINYITYYPFNGHYHLPANLPLFRTGHHVGDWEHLTVRLDASSLELQGVWYNAHRNIEGEWCPAPRVPRTPCGRIVGFVAINGHGTYPHCGITSRLFFVANDRTSRRGPVWSPTRLVRICGLAHGSGCPVVRSRGCSLPYVPGRRGSAGAQSCDGPAPGCFSDLGEESGGSHRSGASSNGLLRPVVPELPGASAGAAAGCAGASVAHEAVQAVAGSGQSAASAGAHQRKSAKELNAVAAGTSATAASGAAHGRQPGGAANGHSRSELAGRQAVFPLPEVVRDTSPWQRYQGFWGSVISATEQGWFRGAEPPVSRGLLRRLFFPCAPGVERLPRGGGRELWRMWWPLW